MEGQISPTELFNLIEDLYNDEIIKNYKSISSSLMMCKEEHLEDERIMDLNDEVDLKISNIELKGIVNIYEGGNGKKGLVYFYDKDTKEIGTKDNYASRFKLILSEYDDKSPCAIEFERDEFGDNFNYKTNLHPISLTCKGRYCNKFCNNLLSSLRGRAI